MVGIALTRGRKGLLWGLCSVAVILATLVLINRAVSPGDNWFRNHWVQYGLSALSGATLMLFRLKFDQRRSITKELIHRSEQIRSIFNGDSNGSSSKMVEATSNDLSSHESIRPSLCMVIAGGALIQSVVAWHPGMSMLPIALPAVWTAFLYWWRFSSPEDVLHLAQVMRRLHPRISRETKNGAAVIHMASST